jgi:hypothetical protein
MSLALAAPEHLYVTPDIALTGLLKRFGPDAQLADTQHGVAVLALDVFGPPAAGLLLDLDAERL